MSYAHRGLLSSLCQGTFVAFPQNPLYVITSLMTRTFRAALLAMLDRTGFDLKAVANGSGVSYEQLKKLKQRPDASTNVDDARAVANFFGLTIDEFLEDNLASDRIALARQWTELTEQERDLLRSAARGRGVLPLLPSE